MYVLRGREIFGISKGISLLLPTFPIPSFLADFFRENCGFLHTCPGRFKFSGRIRKLEKWIRIFFFLNEVEKASDGSGASYAHLSLSLLEFHPKKGSLFVTSFPHS